MREADCTHGVDRHRACADTLRVVIDSEGRINLDSDTTTYLLRCGIDAVRLLWNPDKRTMIFKPVKLTSEFSCRIIRRKKTRQATFSAQRFLRRVGWRTDRSLILPLKWKGRERLLEVVLPPERLFAKHNLRSTGKEAT